MFFPRSHGILRARRPLTTRAVNHMKPGPLAWKSIPATQKYATQKQRMKIQELGNRYGCHTCGAGSPLHQLFHRTLYGELKTIKFLADHCPPNSMAKRMKLEGTDVKQNFYPQCPDCAKKQSVFCNQFALKKRQ